MELDLLLERVKSDVINNERERKEIEKRVEPIDLGQGLVTGEWTQTVPIKEGVLTVKFRTLSAQENEAFRALIFRWNAEDPQAINLSSERFGLMQTVAAIVSISGNAFPSHMRREGARLVFDEEIFLTKYYQVSSYAAPLIHALGTHAFWFDQRVRKMFTSDNLKNG